MLLHPEFEVHRVLDRGEFVVVETLLPSENGTIVHRDLDLTIELGGRFTAITMHAFGADLYVKFD